MSTKKLHFVGSLQDLRAQLSNEKGAPGGLGYIRDFTTQLYGDQDKPEKGFLLNNQYFMERQRRFFRGSMVLLQARKKGSGTQWPPDAYLMCTENPMANITKCTIHCHTNLTHNCR